MNEADVLRVIVTLIFIIMVILAGAWAVRRGGLGRSGNAQALRVVASQSVGNRAWVTVVQVEDARLVLGVTGQQINLLHTLPPADPAANEDASANPSSHPSRFNTAFARALKRR